MPEIPVLVGRIRGACGLVSGMRSLDDTPPLLRLANRQFGVLTEGDLRDHGVSRFVVSRWLKSGRLTRLHRGVYVLGHKALRPEGRWLAAWWACGEDTALSHTSALACLGHGTEDELAPVHISTTREGTTRAGIVVHRVKTLHPLDVCEVGGFRVTTIPRTVVDLADVSCWQDFRDVADRIPKLHLAEVVRAQERAPGRRGSGLVNRLLDADQAHTKSEFERRYLRFCSAFALARPDDKNSWVASHKADCIYYGAKLVVELDGRAYHERRAQMRADRRRDADYQLGGYAILRLVWDDLHPDEAATTAERVRRFLARVA